MFVKRVSLGLLLLISSSAVFGQTKLFRLGPAEGKADAQGFVTYFDAGKSVSSEKTVGSPLEVVKMPVFDNAPFLHLKLGDKLVRGRRYIPMMKGDPAAFNDHDSYFLSSGGQFYDVNDFGREMKLKLWDVSTACHFAWDLNLENASELHKISTRSSTFEFLLSLEQYRAIRQAAGEHFADALRDDTGLTINQPHIVAAEKYAVFESINFDRHTDTIFQYHVAIGPGVYRIRRKPLIVGPRRVRREEFEGREGGGINGPGPYRPSKAEAAQARAEYQKMQAFHGIVAAALPKSARSRFLERARADF